jgi:exodeoxyribonuclease V alpha subunit
VTLETEAAVVRDPFDARAIVRASGLLREFNDAGVLGASDVHVALRLGRLGGEADQAVLLAAALAVRGPRVGHVFVDLATIRETAAVDAEELIDVAGLAWPDPEEWVSRVGSSGLVAVGEEEPLVDRPLRLVGGHLYLDRYWGEERQVAADLLAMSVEGVAGVDLDLLRSGLERLLGSDGGDDLQRIAAAAAVLRRLAVVAGGPGTGKTTTVARIVALLAEQAVGRGALLPLVALAAPTGKAAVRLEEAVHEEASRLAVEGGVREYLSGLRASTLHRLLEWRPGSYSRFRHDRDNPLPHEVVIVDETSMVSLSMMGRLLEAVRPDAQLILVGDPGQLRSIEAGVVLNDIVGPAAAGLRISPAARSALSDVCDCPVPAADPPGGVTIGDGIVVLEHVHRFGGGIARLAEAVRRGDADAAMAVLGAGLDDVLWLQIDVGEAEAEDALGPVRDAAVSAARAVLEAARAGDAPRALAAVGGFRLLCAHRRGPHGVATWNARVEAWLAEEVDDFDPASSSYVGRPLLVSENDYELGLFNGDVGVVVQTSDEVAEAVFDRADGLVSFSPLRLETAGTVYAMTIHKSQGSQFLTAAVLLPPATSRILTRELLYTGVTRARERLLVVGTEETVRAAVGRPVARASGLRQRIWDAMCGTPTPIHA